MRKARGSWASYQDEKQKGLWRCDLDEMCARIVEDGWGGMAFNLNNKKAMEIVLLATAYLKYRDQDKMKAKRKIR